jgi:hypothetical protein
MGAQGRPKPENGVNQGRARWSALPYEDALPARRSPKTVRSIGSVS